MAIDNDKKLDLLWKKVGYGVSQTAPNKAAGEESIASPYAILSTQIWRKADDIPAVAAPVTNVVEQHAIRLLPDVTVAGNKTWLAVRDFATGLATGNRLGDWISFTVAPSYEVRVFRDEARTQRLNPNTANQEWYFDYASGTLWFPNELPAGVTQLFLTGFQYIGPKGVGGGGGGAGSDVLQLPSAGSYDGGFIADWEAGETSIADAIDGLNKAMVNILPGMSPLLAQQQLDIVGGTSGNLDVTYALAAGYTSNLGGFDQEPAVGQPIKRVFEEQVVTDVVGPFGPARHGTVSLEFNGEVVGSRDLEIGPDFGTYGKLKIISDETAPEGGGAMFEAIRASGTALEPLEGLNYAIMRHTVTGATNPAWFVKDSSTTKPGISNITVVADPENPPNVFSSGIPHMVRGSRLLVGARISNLATQLALSAKNVEITSTPKALVLPSYVSPGQYNLANPVPKGNQDIVDVPVVVDDELGYANNGMIQLQVAATNVNGTTRVTSTKRINVMRAGTSSFGGYVDENNIPVVNLGDDQLFLNAYRVSLGNDDRPEVTSVNFDPWDSFQTPPLWEASVVGGAVRCDRNDYRQYEPIGPDNTTKQARQYITFAMQRTAVSQMIIDVTGSYAGLWVKLPGLVDLGTSVNGWWDARKRYEGFGTPGRGTTDGCAYGEPGLGFTQKVHVTFGQESSSNASNRFILVRFALTGNQAITDLKFTGV